MSVEATCKYRKDVENCGIASLRFFLGSSHDLWLRDHHAESNVDMERTWMTTTCEWTYAYDRVADSTLRACAETVIAHVPVLKLIIKNPQTWDPFRMGQTLVYVV